MTAPNATSPVRLVFGVCLALLAAALAVGGLLGQLFNSATLASLTPGPQTMKANSGVAILAACGGWLALQTRSRLSRALGYALAALGAVIAGATLAQHVTHLDFGIDGLIVRDASFSVTGHPGRMSLAVCVALLLTAVAVALTRSRSERAEDLRQLARLGALAIPVFALALYVYDPSSLSIIDGLEETALDTSLAIALLLIAIGFDRHSASLRWNFAYIGVIAIAPLVALTVHFARAERDTALSSAGVRLAAVTQLGAERQAAVIAQTRQMLTFLARSPAVRGSEPTCEWELADYAPVNPWVRALYTVDRGGTVRCADKPPSVSLNVGDREYVKRAFASGRFTVSGFILAKINGQPRIAVALPAPEGRDAELLVVASLDLEALAGPMESLVGDGRAGETVTLIDKSGVVIARRPRDGAMVGANLADATFVTEALVNPDRTFEAADVGGRATLFFASRVLDGEGMLIVGAPKGEIVRPVDARLNRQLRLIAAILAGSLALAVIGSETLIMCPLRRLIAYAGRLEAGDFSARPDVRASGEVGALGRALAVSAAAIEDRELRLARTEALFRGLFDHSPDAKVVVRVEPNGGFRIETWNPAAVMASGLSVDQVVGRTPREVFPGVRGEAIEHDLKRTLDLGRVLTVEREPNIKNLPTVYEMVQVPLRGADGTIERIFLSARDISERKRVERLKNEFVSTVSHELRTPLTSIAGSLGLLSGGAAGPLGERAKHLIAIAHSNSLRLVRLINDILDIEKIEAGRMTFELKSLVVADLVSHAIGGLRAYADEYAVAVELEPGARGVMVYGDEDRLTQVITNLLSNAIKFSPHGGTVTASIAAESEAVAIVVRDCGPGIPESFRSRVFTKFAQADGSDSRRKGGTGLGLAIVREIVERHAGAVTYRSEPGLGAAFEVRLPRHVARDRAAAPTFSDLPSRPKVLVCEDDALMGAILAEQMRDAGFEALTAGTVRAALKIVVEHDIEAILVDLNLPDGDGLGLIRDLRALPKARTLPVVVVSADAERGRLDSRSVDLDVEAWVEKPVNAARLANLIRRKVGPITTRPQVLHVEDDADLCNMVSAAIAPFADVTSVPGLAAARRAIEAVAFDLAILDVALDDGSGLDLMKSLKAKAQPVPVISFSARDVDRVGAGQAAAALTKSRTSLDALVEETQRILAEGSAAPGAAARVSYG